MFNENIYLQNYHKLFDLYLRVLKNNFNPDNYYNNDLKKLCHDAELFKQRLFGMITLLEETKDISSVDADEEHDKVFSAFNTIELFNCYLDEEYEVRVFRDRTEMVCDGQIQEKIKRTELER